MTTVSRALNGYADVSESTRARVIDAARTAGYRPNPVARRLALGRAEAIGLVLPRSVGDFVDPFFTELLRGMATVFEDANLDLIVTAAPEGPAELRVYRRLVEGRRVDGLIVARTRSQDERIEYLLDQDFPFVCHGRTEIDRPYAYLDMDNEGGFLAATERLLGLGHRRIALINAPMNLAFAQARFEGYKRAYANAGIEIDPAILCESELNEESGHDIATRLLDLDDPPTAMLCASDFTALGVMRAVKARGLEIGVDVSIIGYDDIPLAQYADPPLTTMHQQIHRAGGRVAEMLLARMAGTPPEELQEVWPPRLVTRATDGPIRPAEPQGQYAEATI